MGDVQRTCETGAPRCLWLMASSSTASCQPPPPLNVCGMVIRHRGPPVARDQQNSKNASKQGERPCSWRSGPNHTRSQPTTVPTSFASWTGVQWSRPLTSQGRVSHMPTLPSQCRERPRGANTHAFRQSHHQATSCHETWRCNRRLPRLIHGGSQAPPPPTPRIAVSEGSDRAHLQHRMSPQIRTPRSTRRRRASSVPPPPPQRGMGDGRRHWGWGGVGCPTAALAAPTPCAPRAGHPPPPAPPRPVRLIKAPLANAPGLWTRSVPKQSHSHAPAGAAHGGVSWDGGGGGGGGKASSAGARRT